MAIKLTKRRLEFLEHLVRLFQVEQEPVHYAAVADSVGVSKWTAYDVLKELEKAGFLARSYSVNENETGRSVVLYSPTQAAFELFRPVRRSLSALADWNTVREQVSHIAQALEKRSVREAQNRILQASPGVEQNLEFCVWMLGGLIHYMSRMDDRMKRVVIEVSSGIKQPEVLLAMFVGTVSGVVIRSVGRELDPKMSGLVQQFHHSLPDLNQEEVQVMAEFLRQKMDDSFQ
ncbi:heat-inducible transcription repressor HrcA [Tumebacillus sp. BK434]|uniref:Lrp/AsnC family transcriptional regulator n=1 Tax=Tumebacillus sp. BK434 TaxID=2512169 RepID=UPI00104D49FF|nr:Lrp/AsnC family transcriptional regulator [Tumebacillus sp. BK434]TCP59199.1 heat-inducible transcription repressor HrcA [Tumebacillus sp. BK434]